MQVNLRGLALLGEALERLQIRFYVAGGLASATWGQSRFTEDIDLVVDLTAEQVLPLQSALGPDFEVDELSLAEACRLHRSDNIFYLADFTRFDLYMPASSAFVRAQFDRRRRLLVDSDTTTFIASPEDTLLSKLLWFRKGHGVSVKQWDDIAGILRFQRGNLDWTYLQHWAEDLQVTDLLQRAKTDAG